MDEQENQSTSNTVPSTEQQITDLRSNVLEMRSSFTQLLAHLQRSNPPPPQRDPPPHQHQPPNFHDQFASFQAQSSAPFSGPTPGDQPMGGQPHPQPFPTGDTPNPNISSAGRYLEPQKLPEVWFSGETAQLEPFLRSIRNFMFPRKSFFASDARVIIWVSLHFGFRPNENQGTLSRSQNWYQSLIYENARIQGQLSPYADLERLDFKLPILATWQTFEDGLIDFFGDKFQMDRAKAALEACKQGPSSVEDYNTRFSALIYQVNLPEDARIDRYVSGLRLDVQAEAENEEWRHADTLARKMRLATEAAKTLDNIARLSSSKKTSHPHPPPVYHHPHSTHRASDAMDVDAATFSGHRPPSPFDVVFRRVCLAQRICFRCLKRLSPPDHSGPSNCPNLRTSQADKEKFVERYRSAVPLAVSEVSFGPCPPVESFPGAQDISRFWSPPSPPPKQPFQWSEFGTFSSPTAVHTNPGLSAVPAAHPVLGFDEIYDDLSEAQLATVQVRLDTSRSGRIIVPVSFQVSPSKSVVASVLVDTGAMANFINKKFITDHQLPMRLRKTPIRCIGFDGNEGIGGMVTHDWAGRIHVSSTDSSTSVPFPSSFGVTCLGNVDAIFGLPWLNRQSWTASGSSSGGHRFTLGSTKVFVVDAQELGEGLEGKVPISSPSSGFSLPPEFSQFADVFRPQDNCTLPPHRPMDISIKLREGAVHPFGGLYNLSVVEMAQLKEYVDENLSKGFIRVSSSQAAAPIFFVRVPGKKPRPCVDYRGLNSMTVRDSYPIPILGQLLNQLQGCKFFTKIDLKAAFNLLRVTEGDEWKTAFRTPWGLFEYLVMPFGLSNAPACFQRFIQHVLREYLHIFCFVYIDDILIFSRTRAEHTDHVLRILRCLQSHRLFASPDKCSFFAHRVNFLGFVISSDGICMDPDKLSTVVDWPYPETICHLRKFLGFTNFYRKFIARFSEVSAPLTELTKNGVDVGDGLRSDKCLSSFSHLKSCFTKAPLLQHFDFAKKRVLFVDSSKYALAAVLCQTGKDGLLRPVSFLSRKLTPREAMWQVHDQELFAVVTAFQEWRAWLIDTPEPVLVMSDHANLRYFMDSQKLSDRQSRWAAFLVSFNFTIQHVSGKDNPADPATRRPDYVSGDESNENHRQLLSQAPTGLRLTDSSLDTGEEVDLADIDVPVPPQGSSSSSPPPSPSDSDFDLTDPVFCHPTPRLKRLLGDAYRQDPPQVDEDDEFPLRFEHGLWWFKDRIFVPLSLRPYILQVFHDDISAGHVGSLKTLQNITRSLTWPGIRKDVISYTKSCVSCQRSKHSTQRPPGLMIPLSVPERPWSIIGVDFIVKLPISSGFDSILVIVDHFSKAAHLIPAKETWSTEDFASCFMDRFVRYHGLPDKIVSDRGPIFVSRFWTEVQRLLRIKPAPSTAYHPRTDGQTERTNQTIETFIRHFVSYQQDDWSSLLPLAEIVFNSTVSASTDTPPNSLVEKLTSVQDSLKEHMFRAKEIQREYFDRRARDSHPYKVGDWVWLLRRNINSQRPSPKLDFKKLGPFKIEAIIGAAAYRPSIPLGPAISSSREFDESDIDAIIGYRKLPIGSHELLHEYLVTWRNGSSADTAWVKGGLLAISLHPYLLQYHETHGDFPKVLPTNQFIRISPP
ncbi:hypothetical protein MJO29_000799 [Puccinia striiformis f. sp. tritici]|nr:hypothetical protein MJO29_000799 [Puccinia striiformis f. sp. tritici]